MERNKLNHFCDSAPLELLQGTRSPAHSFARIAHSFARTAHSFAPELMEKRFYAFEMNASIFFYHFYPACCLCSSLLFCHLLHPDISHSGSTAFLLRFSNAGGSFRNLASIAGNRWIPSTTRCFALRAASAFLCRNLVSTERPSLARTKRLSCVIERVFLAESQSPFAGPFARVLNLAARQRQSLCR